MIFNYSGNKSQAIKNLIWVYDVVKKIYKYHNKVGTQDDNELDEKAKEKKMFISTLKSDEERMA